MDYTKLGRTGLDVSRICLGCMSFGEPDRGAHTWTLGESDSAPILERALDLGINFFDTADSYSDGTGEEILGRLLVQKVPRDELVLATKVFWPTRPGPNGSGLSRKAVMRGIDASLRRLGTDHVDLYQVHRFDPRTPIEETIDALDDVVRAGKARYLGASSMAAWQLAKYLRLADLRGRTRFVSMQDHYNLLFREEEREVLPMCADEGIGVIPWSPLARGRLARPWQEETARSSEDGYARKLYSDEDRSIVEAVGAIAAARGVSRAQVATAWLLSRPVVTAPIVGATKLQHLEDAVAALDLALTADELASLEKPYTARAGAGF